MTTLPPGNPLGRFEWKPELFKGLSQADIEDVAHSTPGYVACLDAIVNQYAHIKPDDVQAIAAAQIGLLNTYHQIALAQSRHSFAWALLGAGAGLAFFVVGAGFALWTGNTAAALIPVISGAVVEAIAGIVFHLYGKTTSQLGEFHSRLDTLQRYLLANSICGSLQGEAQEKARSDLIHAIARITSEAPKASP